MTPTNPAAPPAGSAQATQEAPTPEAMALVKTIITTPIIAWSSARLIDARAAARVDAATRELRQALEMLRDYQNGPPLPSWEAGWNKAMKMADAALERTALR